MSALIDSLDLRFKAKRCPCVGLILTPCWPNTVVVLILWTRNFVPHCLSTPRCINGDQKTYFWGGVSVWVYGFEWTASSVQCGWWALVDFAQQCLLFYKTNRWSKFSFPSKQLCKIWGTLPWVSSEASQQRYTTICQKLASHHQLLCLDFHSNPCRR